MSGENVLTKTYKIINFTLLGIGLPIDKGFTEKSIKIALNNGGVPYYIEDTDFYKKVADEFEKDKQQLIDTIEEIKDDPIIFPEYLKA